MADARRALVIFLVSSGFILGILPWTPFMPSLSFLLLNHPHWPQLSQVRPALLQMLLRVLSLASQMNCWCVLGVILVHQCSKFSSFLDNCSHRGSLEISKAVQMAFKPFSDWCMSMNLFLTCSEISFNCSLMCCFLTLFSLFHFARQVLFKGLPYSTGLAASNLGVTNEHELSLWLM